ncbi:four helix bundle protein [Candidatus Gottesmanbacteria bacterium]|nr:four helix bundle protein [Candidatus Gottesmanbacteria bacterium]
MKLRYENLEIWQLAMELWKKWQLHRKKFPKEEKYKLTDQLDRSIEGILSTIVEGSAKRSNREFGRYLDISRGSTLESRNHFTLSYHKGYISEQELKELGALLEKIFFKEVAFQKWLFKNDSSDSRASSVSRRLESQK